MSLAMFTWAIAWTNAHIIKDIKYSISSYNLVFLRFAICVVALCPFINYKKVYQILSPINLIYIISTGILFLIYNVCFFKGTAIVAGEGAILVTTINPIITVIIISLIKRTINIKEMVGIVLGVFGGLIIMDVFNFGILNIINNNKYFYFIICAITWGLVTVLTSYAQQKIEPMIFIFFCYVVVMILSYPLSNLSTINLFKLDIVFYLNFFLVSIGAMAIGTSIYMYSTSIIGPVKASAFIFTVPFLAATIAFLVLNEQITSNMVIGGILSLLGVYIVNKQ